MSQFFAVPRYYAIHPALGAGRELNVRAQPDLESPIVGFLIPTECVQCNAAFGDWIQVRYKVYDSAWMLLRNQVRPLLQPVDRDRAERAATSKISPWDWTYDYILGKATAEHTTAGSRDALGNEAFEKKLEEKKSLSTKAQLGVTDQLIDDV